jgi:hypothetical protein
MRDPVLLEFVAVVAAAVFAFMVSLSNRANKTRAAAITSIVVSLFMLAWDRYLYVSTGRGLLDTITCGFMPSALPCKGEGSQSPVLAARSEISPSPANADEPSRSAPETTSQRSGNDQIIVLSDDNARSIWTTSVYSYAPGGGGPGGGRADDKLKVGGWGDIYLSLISVPVEAARKRVRRATLILQVAASDPSSAPTPMTLMRITEPWNWTEGDRLWWKDVPKADFVTTLPPPPAPGSEFEIDITEIYNEWTPLKSPVLGIMLRPTLTNNNFNTFYSTRAEASLRPKLRLLY